MGKYSCFCFSEQTRERDIFEFQDNFMMEQEEYKKEAYNWSYIEFVDNQDVLDLIEKVWSLLSVQMIRSCFYIFLQ